MEVYIILLPATTSQTASEMCQCAGCHKCVWKPRWKKLLIGGPVVTSLNSNLVCCLLGQFSNALGIGIIYPNVWSKQSHDTLVKAAGPVSIIGNPDAFRGRPTTRAFPFPRSQRFRNAAVPESLNLDIVESSWLTLFRPESNSQVVLLSDYLVFVVNPWFCGPLVTAFFEWSYREKHIY